MTAHSLVWSQWCLQWEERRRKKWVWPWSDAQARASRNGNRGLRAFPTSLNQCAGAAQPTPAISLS